MSIAETSNCFKYRYNNPRFFLCEPEEAIRKETSTVFCKCGNNSFAINWIASDHAGGFCKITCRNCGRSSVLIDDFA